MFSIEKLINRLNFFCTCSIVRLFINFAPFRALLHFLDPEKFKSKDDFVQNYKNLSSFNENEVIFYIRISHTSGMLLSSDPS